MSDIKQLTNTPAISDDNYDITCLSTSFFYAIILFFITAINVNLKGLTLMILKLAHGTDAHHGRYHIF